ncbi:MAG: hypothetical protein ACP6IY_08075 [Promethearchaeia archaeon]
MKVLLDTSYFLPLIKISIEGVPDNLLLELLLDKKNYYFYSDLTLFELAAKGFKLIKDLKELTIQDVINGINSIINDFRLNPLYWINDDYIIELASKFKIIHNDTIDCLIFATAICKCECIATLDHNFFKNIKRNKEILEYIEDINKNFLFWFDNLVEEPISIFDF